MSLIGDEAASIWRPLVLFWCSIAAVAVVGGTVLALLGPPSEPPTGERVTGERPTGERTVTRLQSDGAVSDKAAFAMPKPPVRRAAEASPQPRIPVPEPAPPPPTPRLPTAQPPAVQAPGSAAQADAPPRGRIAVLLHPARPEGGVAILDRLATRAGLVPDQVDLGTTSEARSEAAIRFFSETDHALARRLGRELAGMGYPWRLENYSQRPGASKDQTIEVWLPNR